MNKLNKSLSKKEVYLVISIAIVLIAIPYYSINFESLEQGNYVATMLSPLLSFIGSVIVYITFKAQIEANKQVQEQFKIQTFESIFFKILDNLSNRINNYELTELDTNNTHKGTRILDYFYSHLSKECDSLKYKSGLQILLNSPFYFSKFHFQEIFNKFNYENWTSINEVEKFFEYSNEKSKKDLKTKALNKIEENCDLEDWEKFIGGVFDKFFYHQNIWFFRDYYSQLTIRINENYATFFDGYFKNIKLILLHIEKQTDPQEYIDFLTEHLTTFEKVLILLWIASGKSGDRFRNLINNYKLLESLNDVKGIRPARINNEERYKDHIKQLLTDEGLPLY
ncbi:hypothetical protein OA93_10420 [Flavobacterium sp. KMS]|uniref:putative phage abortive infection protein n=1 Tax=Flavobacterium sp. KMS TaxID=1566023 RepID=UPI00057CD022|nr:putative phage abortive infection protein [Flavobacterium sp. KMS]KIA98196.1 hypothetical protein OA93_10420 [Flavobacterium sp. KMS]